MLRKCLKLRNMGEISMQQLKEQRLTPAEKYVVNKIKGAGPRKPDSNGDIAWYKDGKWLFTQSFNNGWLSISWFNVKLSLITDSGISHREIVSFLTRLLYKYTNNGQLKIKFKWKST